jgi:class 3 adenylate cyclase/predicted ATPase
VIACSACAAENPDSNRFCGSCGARLEPEDTAPREARKVVTAVFVDLVGFTSRVEQLDPEDVRRVLGPYYSGVRAELERFGGTVEKFIGDAVVAVFGAPIAHEDDPERAVRAAIEVRDRIAGEEDDLQARIGVNTGEALVRLDADPATGEGMVTGDVINTASRLQGLAPVGGILAGERTYRATRNSIEYRDHDAIAAKGKSEPVAVWEAVAPVRRLGVDLTTHARTPLMGRARELELVTSALARVREERAGQLVTLIGVPGIGKSRLVYEVSRVADQDPELITWRQGRCLPYGEGVSYWALGEIVKAQAGIRDNDPPNEVRVKLRAAVEAVIADTEERAWVEAQLLPLLGAGDGATAGSQGSAAAGWLLFLEGLAERGPCILVIEDLHWADDGLLDFVDELAERVTDVPLLILGTSRPELLQRRPSWGGGKTNAVTLSLAALRDEDTSRLLDALLGDESVSSEHREELVARAGGNPLYAEQYAHMLTERGELGEHPETVQGIIAARIDGLPADEKAVLLDASVLGKVFWLGAVAKLGARERDDLAHALHGLERKDFVQRARAATVEGELEYAFRHVLLRDVAYAELPRPVRAEKHKLAAEWLESLGARDDVADLRAHHYSAALELVRASGETDDDLVERAIAALTAAGEHAIALTSFTAAAGLFEEALELAGDGHPQRGLLLGRSGEALSLTDQRELGPRRLAESIEVCRSQGDAESAATAASALAWFYWIEGDRRRSDHNLALALDLVADGPPSDAKFEVLRRQAANQMMAGDFDEAIATGESALALAEQAGVTDRLRIGRARIALGSARTSIGDRRGIAELESVIAEGRESGVAELVLYGLNNLAAAVYSLDGDVIRAAAQRRESTELSRRHGVPHFASAGESERIGHEFAAGRVDAALEGADRWIAAMADRPEYADPQVLAVRALIHLDAGRVDLAREDSAQAVELAGESDNQAQAQAYPVRARVAIADGELSEGRELAVDLQKMAQTLVPALNFPGVTLPDIAWVFVDLGMHEELGELLTATPFPSPWLDAAEAVGKGDALGAAEILERCGHLAAASYCRERATGTH